MAQHCSNN
jgi:hypothetical protein